MSACVGLLGGGQLARMLILAGAPLGMRFRVFDVNADACAGQLATLQVANFEDAEALREFATHIDLATFDFENVPVTAARGLATSRPVFPSPEALGVTQDRWVEKQLFTRLGIPVGACRPVDSLDDLRTAVDSLGLPAVLKTRRLGYDGKGQYLLRELADIDLAWRALGSSALILEAFVAFRGELSVLAVRSREGDFRAYPPTRNWHRNGILSVSMAPAVLSEQRLQQAIAYARALAESLDYTGCFALELFDTEQGLLANEMAPRVHNSGHWTIEGAQCSQFENHLRAVAGLPLGSTAARGQSLMLNCVGSMPEPEAVLRLAGWHWHDYGKSSREGRKVGHLSTVADSEHELRCRYRAVCDVVPGAASRWIDPWAD